MRVAITARTLIGACLLGALPVAAFTSDASAQAKARIAVTAFENKIKNAAWWDPSWKIGEGLAEMLTSELVRTNRFIVVERQGISDVVGEQALGQSGLVRRDTAARTGELLGAQLVVRGAVTEFEAQARGGGAGFQNSRVAIEGRGEAAHVAIDLRLIDATTGQVIASQNISKLAPGGGGAIAIQNSRAAFGGDLFMQTPIGQATRAAIQEAVQLIVARGAIAAPLSFSIVKVDGAVAYINAGANANVRVGDVLQVYTRGEDLTDPETGLKLGSSEKLIGAIQVTEVQEQFSIGAIRGGSGVMQRGDRVRR